MILLTRLTGSVLYLNADLVATVETQDGTVVTLVDGQAQVVRETAAEVVQRITTYRALVLAEVERHLVPPDPTLGFDEHVGGQLLHLHAVPERV